MLCTCTWCFIIARSKLVPQIHVSHFQSPNFTSISAMQKKTKIRLLGHTGSDLQETLLAGNNSVINENKAITNREKTHNIVQTNRINSLDLALLQEPFKRLNTGMSAIKCKSQRCDVVCSFLDSFDSGNAI